MFNLLIAIIGNSYENIKAAKVEVIKLILQIRIQERNVSSLE